MCRWAREVEFARGELAQSLKRMLTEEEVAQKLGVGIVEHRVFLQRCRRAQVGSLEASSEHHSNLHDLVADSRAPDPQ